MWPNGTGLGEEHLTNIKKYVIIYKKNYFTVRAPHIRTFNQVRPHIILLSWTGEFRHFQEIVAAYGERARSVSLLDWALRGNNQCCRTDCRGPLFGKSGAHMEVARSSRNFSYGVSGRKFGPGLPPPARQFQEIRRFGPVRAIGKKNCDQS